MALKKYKRKLVISSEVEFKRTYVLCSFIKLAWKKTYLRTVQVCGQHDDGVSQHISSICAGKKGLSAKRNVLRYKLTVLQFH